MKLHVSLIIFLIIFVIQQWKIIYFAVKLSLEMFGFVVWCDDYLFCQMAFYVIDIVYMQFRI